MRKIVVIIFTPWISTKSSFNFVHLYFKYNMLAFHHSELNSLKHFTYLLNENIFSFVCWILHLVLISFARYKTICYMSSRDTKKNSTLKKVIHEKILFHFVPNEIWNKRATSGDSCCGSLSSSLTYGRRMGMTGWNGGYYASYISSTVGWVKKKRKFSHHKKYYVNFLSKLL